MSLVDLSVLELNPLQSHPGTSTVRHPNGSLMVTAHYELAGVLTRLVLESTPGTPFFRSMPGEREV